MNTVFKSHFRVIILELFPHFKNILQQKNQGHKQ